MNETQKYCLNEWSLLTQKVTYCMILLKWSSLKATTNIWWNKLKPLSQKREQRLTRKDNNRTFWGKIYVEYFDRRLSYANNASPPPKKILKCINHFHFMSLYTQYKHIHVKFKLIICILKALHRRILISLIYFKNKS